MTHCKSDEPNSLVKSHRGRATSTGRRQAWCALMWFRRRRTQRCQGRALRPHLWSRGPPPRCRPRPVPFERRSSLFEIAFLESWSFSPLSIPSRFWIPVGHSQFELRVRLQLRWVWQLKILFIFIYYPRSQARAASPTPRPPRPPSRHPPQPGGRGRAAPRWRRGQPPAAAARHASRRAPPAP